MKRKEFIQKSVLASAVGLIAPGMLKATNVRVKNSDYDKLDLQQKSGQKVKLHF